MRSGPEIQDALAKFVAKWSGYTGSEKAEAQTFLNELFAAYGSDRSEVGALFEDFKSSAGFMDLHWPGVLIVEMKRPQASLEKAKEQRQRYWQESDQGETPAARFVSACNFQQFEIWEPGRFPSAPRMSFPLSELPDRYDVLNGISAWHPESPRQERPVDGSRPPPPDRHEGCPGPPDGSPVSDPSSTIA